MDILRCHIATFLFLLIYNTSLVLDTSAEDICIELTARFTTTNPDGVRKEIITLNDRFPGPTIRAKKGDTLTVRVHNQLQDGEGHRYPTSVHFHGIEMVCTPWYDGPEQVAQCPIQFNSFMDYTFTLHQSGTYWYHSHHNWQYIDGFWGLLIIDNDPGEVHKYDDELMITIMDWHHRSGEVLTRLLRLPEHESNPEAGQTPVPDSALINGRGNANCTLARELNYTCDDRAANTVTVFDVIPRKTYRIRVINPSARAAFNFSIDGHSLRAIEVDGVDTVLVDPVDAVTIWPAQRYSFLVTMNVTWFGGNSWIRTDMIVGTGDQERIGRIQPLAALHYLGATPPRQGSPTQPNLQLIYDREEEIAYSSEGGGIQGRPASHQSILDALEDGEQVDSSTNRTMCRFTKILDNLDNSQTTVSREYFAVWSFPNPYKSFLDPSRCKSWSPGVLITAPDFFDEEIVINATLGRDQYGFLHGFMNNRSYTTERSQVPAVLRAMQRERVPRTFNPFHTPTLQKVIQVVINNLNPGEHPWHLHGHTFWVMGVGDANVGAFNPRRDHARLNNTGLRRDTTHTPPQSWTVIRYTTDNPGVWLLHCHIHWHFSFGLGAVFVEADKELQTLFKIPDEARRVCQRHGVYIS